MGQSKRLIENNNNNNQNQNMLVWLKERALAQK
jgi:hypothetical protein